MLQQVAHKYDWPMSVCRNFEKLQHEGFRYGSRGIYSSTMRCRQESINFLPLTIEGNCVCAYFSRYAGNTLQLLRLEHIDHSWIANCDVEMLWH